MTTPLPPPLPTPGADGPAVRRVVGLKADPGDVPYVLLKGAGPLADELLRRRDPRVDLRVVRDEELLAALYRLPLDARIDPSLFHVVAVILAHVFALESQARAEQAPRRP